MCASTQRSVRELRLLTRVIYRNWTTATTPIKAVSICNPSRRTVLVSRWRTWGQSRVIFSLRCNPSPGTARTRPDFPETGRHPVTGAGVSNPRKIVFAPRRAGVELSKLKPIRVATVWDWVCVYESAVCVIILAPTCRCARTTLSIYGCWKRKNGSEWKRSVDDSRL